MTDKPLVWVGSSLEDLRDFPPVARRAAGFQLRRLQSGLMPSDWKPMSDIGAGVQEIRIHAGREYRVLYVAKFVEAVYVLHAFEKRTRKTNRDDVARSTLRYGEVLTLRSNRKEF